MVIRTTLCGDATSFWCVPGPPPSYERIQREGCNCAGFVNLVARKYELEIPGIAEQPVEPGSGFVTLRRQIYCERNRVCFPGKGVCIESLELAPEYFTHATKCVYFP